MGNQKILYAVLGVIVFAVVGFFTLSNNKQVPTQPLNTTEEKADVKSAITEDTNNSDEFSERFIAYSDENLKKATEKGRAVIYFWASWCPTCKVLDKELREKGSELPDDVTILKTNYDTKKELKKKYQIIQQHTLVQVDKNGNEVKKWIGGNIDVIKQELVLF